MLVEAGAGAAAGAAAVLGAWTTTVGAETGVLGAASTITIRRIT